MTAEVFILRAPNMRTHAVMSARSFAESESGVCSLWDRVQAKLAADSTNRTTAGKHRQYLLSGLIRCGVCESHYVIGSTLKGARRYRCSRRATRGPEACDNKATVAQEALERKVKHILDSVAKEPEQLASLVKERNARVDEHNEEHAGEADRLTAQRDESQRTLDRLIEAIESGGASATVMQAIQKREKEVQQLTAEIDRARSMSSPSWRLVSRSTIFASGQPACSPARSLTTNR